MREETREEMREAAEVGLITSKGDMITGWRCNNRLPNRLLCYPFFWSAHLDSRKLSPKSRKYLPSQIVALQMTIWGQYRANCEVAGTPYVYKKCASAECRPVEPYTTMYAEQLGAI